MDNHSRLAVVESLLIDMHWVTVGQWQIPSATAHCYPFESDEAAFNGQESTPSAEDYFGEDSDFVGNSSVVQPGDGGSLSALTHPPAGADAEEESAYGDVLDATGDWERLDPWLFLDARELSCISQTCSKSYELVRASTPLFTISSNIATSTHPEDNVVPDVVPTLTSLDMLSAIDIVVDKASSASPDWHKIPAEAVADLTQELKAQFLEEDQSLYTEAQAVKLMEETGRICGELVQKYRHNSGKNS